MIRSTNGHAIAASRKKKIVLVNQLVDDGLDLSQIASELNIRGFKQDNGVRFSWKSASDFLDDENLAEVI